MERLDTFMARCNAAYYATHDPFGDFTTSPEISQVFGELLGAWAAVAWEAMGRPSRVVLAELGPGRGTLMQDALRAIRSVAPDFAASLSLHLVETSQRLRAIQADRLAATWHDDFSTLPPGPIIVLANEFLDALPIRQFVSRDGVWKERWVAASRFVERDGAPPCRSRPQPGQDDTIIEINEASEAVVAAIAARVSSDGGAALFLDYGGAGGGGDTLQALKNGRPADPLACPGKADLTAHVDFAGLSRLAGACGATVYGPVPQGMFLARLGLHQRSFRLAQGQQPGRASALLTAAERLSEPAHMGRLFKALALTQRGLQEPPGFSQ